MPEPKLLNIYISGPMGSKPEFNFPQFKAMEVELYEHSTAILAAYPGYTYINVVNPARNFDGDTQLGREVYLELALRQVDAAEVIVLLPDWQGSEGARLETMRAIHNGATFYECTSSESPLFTHLLGPFDPDHMDEVLAATAKGMDYDPNCNYGKECVEEGLLEDLLRADFKAAVAGRDRFLDSHQPQFDGTEVADWEDELLGDWDTDPNGTKTEASVQHMIAKAQGETIEQEAARLVRNGARQGTYGHPRGDFDTIAQIWSAILTKANGQFVDVRAEEVALCMAGLKLSRLARDPHHHDSKVDVIGYMVCLDRLDEEDE